MMLPTMRTATRMIKPMTTLSIPSPGNPAIIFSSRVFPTGNQIDERAECVGEHDDQRPHDALVVAQPFVADAVDEHPDPEGEEQQAEHAAHSEQEQDFPS